MRRLLRTVGLVVALWAGACATRQTEAPVLPPDEQFSQARALFDQREYLDAIGALQAFAFNYPQDPRVVDARWLTAEAYYRLEDWAAAAQEYLNFQRDFPRHDRAPEALYQAGRSYQEMSLRPELDQRDTERAIHVYERLLNEYPSAELTPEAQDRYRELRNKLAEKVYLNAEYYFDNEEYRAAEIYLVQLIEGHADSDWLPAGYALLAETYCQQGLGDRAAEVAARLVDSFPESSAARTLPEQLSAACRPTPGPAVRANAPEGG